MKFKVQYIQLRYVPPINELEDIIRESFKQKVFNGLSLKLSKVEFEPDYSLSFREFYHNLVEKLYAAGIFGNADMTIVFCNESFIEIEKGGDPEHRSQIFHKSSISYLGSPGEFNFIPPLVNLETARKVFNVNKGWVYVNLRGELIHFIKHEYGHSMGCDHCKEPSCVMNENSINYGPNTDLFCDADVATIKKSLEKYFSNIKKVA